VPAGAAPEGQDAAEETLWHPVPRLDAPDRVWLLPAPQAKWLAAGVFSGPLAAQVLALLGGYGPADVWGLPVVWLAWTIGLLLGAAGAFWRPGGLHAGQWAAALAGFVLAPRRAVWKPTGRGVLWW
jgi:hypothetical protein